MADWRNLGTAPSTLTSTLTERMRPTTSVGPVAASFGLALLIAGQAGDLTAQALPGDMLKVPGGKVSLGATAKDLLETTKAFYPRAPRNRIKLLRNLLSELGEKEVEVGDFLLHRYLVTNEQYLQFVQATNHRFPFHWWKEGRKDDWNERRAAARDAFKGQAGADLLYWEAKWDQLPYAIPAGTEKHPVIFVSWLDAQAFAGWAGMRLPTEAEWVLAARGDSKTQYLWGEEWDDEMLGQLKLAATRDKVLKQVGLLGEVARGAFGHDDMVGNVWEWTSEVGYFPLAAEASFKKEFDKLKKNKAVAEITLPDWNGSRRIIKGGCYFSHQNPAEFRIGTRGNAGSTEAIEGIGFRVAKSTVPARDMSKTRIAVEYDGSFFGSERSPNVDDQVGIERYDLSPDGALISNYHAISMVPVNHMGLEKSLSLDKLKDESQEKPLIVGTFISTEPIASPALEPQMYTVYYREKGMPKELAEALRTGSLELLAAQRAAEIAQKRGGKKSSDDTKKKGDETDEDHKRKAEPDWRSVLSKYGITEEEATVKNAHTEIDFIRIKPGNLKVPLEQDVFLFRKNLGDFAATLPSDKDLKLGSYKGATLEMGTLDNKETLTFTFGSPWSEKLKSKILNFTLTVQLPEPPDVSKPWATPDSVARPVSNGNHDVEPQPVKQNESKLRSSGTKGN